MKRAKPAIPRHFLIAMVTLVIPVMQLVIKRAQREATFILDQEIFVSCVGHCRDGAKVDDLKDHKDRIAGHDPVNAKRGAIEKMFNRMHGKARPRADVDVAMMQRMHMGVEERHMQKTMHPVEMKR